MDYREFTGAVEDQMNRRLKGGVKASLYTAVKNNGKERTGLLIESPGINISPTIYLEEYFEDYQKGKCLGMIVDEILGFYDSIKREGPWDCEMLKNYDGVKDRIVFKLVNTLKNRKFLSTVPHRSYLDLSVVFYVLLEVTADGTAAMTVSESHMEQWRVRTDTLWSDAVRNSRNLLPAEFFKTDEQNPLLAAQALAQTSDYLAEAVQAARQLAVLGAAAVVLFACGLLLWQLAGCRKTPGSNSVENPAVKPDSKHPDKDVRWRYHAPAKAVGNLRKDG